MVNSNSTLSWDARVVSNGNYKEPSEVLTDVIKNGVLHISPSLSDISYYWSSFSLALPQGFNGDNFKFEAKIKNPSSEGGLSAYDIGLGFSSTATPANGVGVAFMDGSWAVSYTGVNAPGLNQHGISSMVVSLSDWHTLGVEAKNQNITVYYDGNQVAQYPYVGKIGDIDSLGISTKGSGSVDWVKATSNGLPIIEDNFDSITTTSPIEPINSKINGMVGERGNIETNGDVDWFKISLPKADRSYIFHANKTGVIGALSDPVLTLYRDDGKGGVNIVWSDDNSGGNSNALINFTVTSQSTGDYYLAVKDSSSGTGTYTVTVEQDKSVAERPYFIQALDSGRHWGNIAQSNSFTYSFASKNSAIIDSQDWDATQKEAMAKALGKYSVISGLTFTERPSGELPVTNNYDHHIVFNIKEINDNNKTLAAFANWPLFQGSGDGDVYVDDDQAGTYNAGVYTPNTVTETDKSFLFETYLHEIGHALGLKHSFEGLIQLPKAEDDHNHTVMSYTHIGDHVTDLQWIDQATVHYLYGVNKNVRSGNDTYHIVDRYIWDGDGKSDILDESAQTLDLTINLNAGSWIYAGTKNASIFEIGQAFIGYGTQIEMAKGGNGNDSITGNNAANGLSGGAGNDTLSGGLGKDVLVGGLGADTFKFNSVADSSVAIRTNDTIFDFKSIEVDKINLSEINANTALVGNQEFSFIGSTSFNNTNAAGQLRFDATTKILYGSTDADNAAEFTISLSGVTTLSQADFVL